MLWSELVNGIAAIFEIPILNTNTPNPSSSTSFNTILPRAIEYAELRILREFDLIAQNISSPVTLVVNNRNVNVPGNIYLVDEVNLITPASTQPDNGTRNPMQRISRAMLNAVCPQAAVPVAGFVPRFYYMQDDNSAVIGPSPAATYVLEFLGPIRPAPMSSSNQETWIGDNLPDLFFAAVAYFMAGYQRDFGAQSEDPKLASSWNSTYEQLKTPALIEEARKKAESVAWQPYSPTPVAEPRE